LARGVYEGMFEQSMLLSSAPGKKAGALAASLGAQTLAVGTLLLLPLLYTDRLPFVQLQLPTFMPSPPPPEHPKSEPTPRTRPGVRIGHVFTVPTAIPPLNTQPEIIDTAPGLPDRIDPGSPVPLALNMIFTHVIPPPPQVIEPAPSAPVSVTSEIQSAKLMRKVIPVYPRMAIIAHISGTVRLIGKVGTDGTVQQIQVVSDPALLVQAALDAVRQWVYRPTLLHGKPVEVVAPIDVTFNLSQ